MRRFRKREVDRRIWVRPWIRRRNALGAHHALLSELRNEDQTSFKNFVRMDPEAFDELLELVTPLIKRRDTWLRDAIPAAERLSLTLRFLATGNRKRIAFKKIIQCSLFTRHMTFRMKNSNNSCAPLLCFIVVSLHFVILSHVHLSNSHLLFNMKLSIKLHFFFFAEINVI